MSNKRQMERNKARELKKEDVSYTMSYARVKEITHEIINKEQNKIYKVARDHAIRDLFAVVVHSLHDEFGFGAKRLSRLFNRIEIKFDCITEGTITVDDIIAENKNQRYPFELEFKEVADFEDD